MKQFFCMILACVFILGAMPAFAETDARPLRILFTHDIHSYFDISKTMRDGEVYEHGGVARLKTLIDRWRDESTLYLDAGDYSMGTLLQAGFATDAFELRLLGQIGCAASTFGNHEFDLGNAGAASMLESALASGDPLPTLVQSNMVTEGELSAEQRLLADAMSDYGVRKYAILEVNGLRVGVFGLLGLEAIEYSPTCSMDFVNYIEAAKETVQAIQAEGVDVIVCLSHSGTSGDGQKGEDFDLAKAVPEIDVIISGHSHSSYAEPAMCGDTIIVSCGEYLTNLCCLDLQVSGDAVICADYRLIPCDGSVPEDPEMAAVYAQYKQRIHEDYLSDKNCGYDDVICRSAFDFMPLEEMYATHQEYPLGNLIADSYMYAANQNGIDDIDVALVGLGTIRGSILTGDVTVANAFEICSLGVGADGSAGHPILAGYLSGEELKLLVELDASVGEFMSAIKMSYSGLRYSFSTDRLLLNRVYDLKLVRPDGTEEEIENGRLYKVVCNMYAANMLGMLNGLTLGMLKIVPKDADGTPIEDLYVHSLRGANGEEIKEWVAFKDYLASFPTDADGVPVIPTRYAAPEGRKLKVHDDALARVQNPGVLSIIVFVLQIAVIAWILLLIFTHKQRKARREARRAQKKAARSAAQSKKQNDIRSM